MYKFPECIDPYDKTSGSLFIRTEHLARYFFAAEFIGKHRLRRILDTACGNGYGSLILSLRAKSIEGINYNIDQIEQGRKRIAGDNIRNVTLHVSDLNDGLGRYHEDAFDCVVCYETLEHVQKDIELLLEFNRVLRRGGWLLLSVPKSGYEPVDVDGRPINLYHLRLYELNSFKAQIEKCGFALEFILGQPYANVARSNMESFHRDKGTSYEEINGFFVETQNSLEFFAKLWGWPVEDCNEKSNVMLAICRRL